MDIVNGVEDKTASWGDIIELPSYLITHLLRRATRQHLLRIHAAAVESEVFAELFLEVFGVHARTTDLHGLRISMPDSIRSGISEAMAPQE